MKAAACALAAVSAALIGAGGGYWRGKADGAAAKQAQQDQQTVASLGAIIASHGQLIEQANAASLAMRQALTRREALDRKSTGELRHALDQTADSRANCAFPADVLRQLQAARDRAAQAAAAGIRGALSGASGADQP